MDPLHWRTLQSKTVDLPMLTLGDVQEIETILSVSQHPRWPGKVRSVCRVSLSCVTVAGVITLTFDYVNTAQLFYHKPTSSTLQEAPNVRRVVKKFRKKKWKCVIQVTSIGPFWGGHGPRVPPIWGWRDDADGQKQNLNLTNFHS